MIALRHPFDNPWHVLGLEIVVLGAAGLLLWHALARYRAGHRRALVQWLVVFCYGLSMEAIAFAFIQNYRHAQFTVQLAGGKLPLYVAGVYVVFLYTALEIGQRLGRGPLPEALLVGLAACLIDVPFDIAGIALGWWSWADGAGWAERVIAYRWLGVPVTSYLWYLIFGAVLALLCRTLGPRLARRRLAAILALSPAVGLAVITGGVVAFLPFHLAKALGVGDGTFTALWIGACAVVAFLPRAGTARPLDRRVAAVAVLVGTYHVGLLLWLAVGAGIAGGAARLAWGAVALAGVVTLVWGVPAWGRVIGRPRRPASLAGARAREHP